ncbi:MAG: Si-specific NAD(P)(+) transhydrogenase [Phycisphaerales bacterium]|nr:Si-specific NAD(P)(+) transhydrogenase [Phycisphaerales bacterium]
MDTPSPIDAAYEFDLVVVGSGPAGQRAAVQAAKLSKRVALVERRRAMGGTSLEFGTIPSKTFREAVLSLLAPGAVRNDHDDYSPSTRPTMAMLSHRVEQVQQSEQRVIREALQRNGVTLIHGHASLIDANTVMAESPDGDRRISTKYVFLGTGSTPFVPPNTSIDGEAIFTSDDILTARSIPRTLVVVGAGVIGIEYASIFAALGTQVTVVERASRLLPFADSEISDELVHELRAKRVNFRFNETVAQVGRSEGGLTRSFVESESGKRIGADAVLITAGRTSCSNGLHLDAVGITPDSRGRLKVDSFYRTSVPNIYAAGDLIGFPSLAATGAEQGRIAACHMFGVEVAPMGDNYPYGIYAIPELSMVGATEETLTAACTPYEIGVARYHEIARGQITGYEAGFLKLLFHRETRLLLGVHVLGDRATELVHIGQAVLKLGGGLDYFLNTVFNYPTYTEAYKTAALNAVNRFRNV